MNQRADAVPQKTVLDKQTRGELMADQMTGVTHRLASYCARATYDELSADAIDAAKQRTLDTLACIVAGRNLPPGRLASSFAADGGGPGEATLLGTSRKVPADMAAFANAVAVHADEIDDVGETLNHPGAAVIPAAIAAAQYVDAGGRDLINAIVLGYDVCARVIRAVGPQAWLFQNKHTTGDSMLVLGAVAAVGRLLGLTARQHEYAFGYAAMYAGTTIAFMDDNTHVSKAVNLGNAARSGYFAARLSSHGFPANEAVFEAPHGVMDVWAGTGNIESLVDGLGTDFEICRTHTKLYSAGYPIHAPVHGVLEIMRKHHLSVSDIEEIRLTVSGLAADVVVERSTPSISVGDMVAVAALAGQLGVKEAHSAELLMDPVVRRLRRRIRVERTEGDIQGADYLGAHVSVETVHGVSFDVRIDRAPGDFRDVAGFGWPELETKFRSLCEGELLASQVEQVILEVQSLDASSSVEELCALLASRSEPNDE